MAPAYVLPLDHRRAPSWMLGEVSDWLDQRYARRFQSTPSSLFGSTRRPSPAQSSRGG
jgi:hypothetical protein